MPFNTLEKRRAYTKKYLEENKDKINAKRREKYKNDEEYRNKAKASDKRYYDKVKNKEWQKENYQKNKDKHKEYKKKYIIDIRINRWIRNGIKFTDDKHTIHNYWLNTENCELCNYKFDEKDKKCLDHDHLSGYNRFVCCHSCNMKLSTRDRIHNYVLLELHRYFNINEWEKYKR